MAQWLAKSPVISRLAGSKDLQRKHGKLQTVPTVDDGPSFRLLPDTSTLRTELQLLDQLRCEPVYPIAVLYREGHHTADAVHTQSHLAISASPLSSSSAASSASVTKVSDQLLDHRMRIHELHAMSAADLEYLHFVRQLSIHHSRDSGERRDHAPGGVPEADAVNGAHSTHHNEFFIPSLMHGRSVDHVRALTLRAQVRVVWCATAEPFVCDWAAWQSQHQRARNLNKTPDAPMRADGQAAHRFDSFALPQAYIVVYPQPNDLYRVDLFTRNLQPHRTNAHAASNPTSATTNASYGGHHSTPAVSSSAVTAIISAAPAAPSSHIHSQHLHASAEANGIPVNGAAPTLTRADSAGVQAAAGASGFWSRYLRIHHQPQHLARRVLIQQQHRTPLHQLRSWEQNQLRLPIWRRLPRTITTTRQRPLHPTTMRMQTHTSRPMIFDLIPI